MHSIPTIMPNSITRLEQVGKKLIFKVYLNGRMTPELVIKREAGGNSPEENREREISIEWSSRIMKNIQNRQILMKPLQNFEQTEFERSVTATFSGTPKASIIAEFSPAYRYQSVWMKMPAIEGLEDSEHRRSGGEDKIRKIAQIVQTMSHDRNWLELGKVLAADIFSGNFDRFTPDGTRWQNDGNLVFANNKIIGLDTWDPNSPVKNFTRDGRFNSLDILKSNLDMGVYARNVTNAFSSALVSELAEERVKYLPIVLPNGQRSKLKTKRLTKLFEPYQALLEAGMRLGVTQIKTYLLSKVPAPAPGGNQQRRGGVTIGSSRTPWQQAEPAAVRVRNPGMQGRLPAGVMDRMQALGWI